MTKHTPLARRTLLRGMGMSLGLPWLEAMAATPNAAPPVRFAALYMPNGVRERTRGLRRRLARASR